MPNFKNHNKKRRKNNKKRRKNNKKRNQIKNKKEIENKIKKVNTNDNININIAFLKDKYNCSKFVLDENCINIETKQKSTYTFLLNDKNRKLDLNNDINKLKKIIDIMINEKDNKICKICFNNCKECAHVSCNNCANWYCSYCYYTIFKNNKGIIICPFCRYLYGEKQNNNDILMIGLDEIKQKICNCRLNENNNKEIQNKNDNCDIYKQLCRINNNIIKLINCNEKKWLKLKNKLTKLLDMNKNIIKNHIFINPTIDLLNDIEKIKIWRSENLNFKINMDDKRYGEDIAMKMSLLKVKIMQKIQLYPTINNPHAFY